MRADASWQKFGLQIKMLKFQIFHNRCYCIGNQFSFSCQANLHFYVAFIGILSSRIALVADIMNFRRTNV